LLTLGDISFEFAVSAGFAVSAVVGVFIGLGVTALVIWLTVKPSSEQGVETRQMITPDRYSAMERVAAIYTPISFACLVIAVVNGGGGFIAITAVNAALGFLAFVLARRTARRRV
jgi:hypothetical protein